MRSVETTSVNYRKPVCRWYRYAKMEWIIQYPSHRRRLARQDRSEAAPPGGRCVLSLHLSCRCIGREFQEPRTNSKTARPASVHPDELGKDVAFSRRKKCRAKEGFLIGC